MAVLDDVLAPGLDIVFCGTAVGLASRRAGAYYAGPGNRFWTVLAEVGLTPRRLSPQECWGVTAWGLGFTDLAKSASGMDKVLAKTDFGRDALRAKVLAVAPSVLAFTGKRAAQEFVGHRVAYGVMEETIGSTRLFVLPSPSGAAGRYWSVGPWVELARLRAELRGG